MILKKLLKGIALVISVLMLIISLGVLGKDEWLVTQIATIFYPMMFSWVFIISLLTLVIGIYKLAKEKWNLKALSKMSIAFLLMSSTSLSATSIEFVHYRNAIVKNGANINLLSSMDAVGKKGIPDEKMVYATKEREELSISIYKPKQENLTELRPVYVYVHGGGWSSSDSESNANYHQMMKEEGYVSFSINYRLATDDRPTWDKQIEDVNDAMKWIYENAKNYGGDPERIFLSGESAGGNLALVYGGRVSEGSLDGPMPKALTVIYPAIDLKWTSENARFMTPSYIPGIVERYIGGSLEKYPERVKAVNPLTFVNKNLPPVLIIHGQKDTMVTINGSRDYINELNKLGVKNQLAEIPYSNHGTSARVNFDITMNFLKDIKGMRIEK
ncbi:alpha/beta hydrolase [Streptococcus saliviloxodontae]|uniref:Acetyl esterase/lipase n=1 Tax=Streptococcus saliviloxodontae TaxID=1349416 RepID=A0ABS2PNF4_9STRE|nr:alpha/beta hydrolase [Streptococcus saliviloxodontae]MBM7636968.1 acetyl esterase/lipase [Streptococcus saliviloxodontae]